LTDGSYTGDNFASRINDLIGATVEVVKRDELHTLRSAAKTMGRRTIILLAREVPTVVEEL
jgi:hypothetical protein